MKIAVLGSGGVGGFFGGMLAQAGADVVFVARGSHLRAIRARGLTIERPDAAPIVIAPVDATDDAAEVGPVDLILLAVKTYDLPQAAALLAPMIAPHTAVLTLQNGVEAPEIVAAAVGAEHLLPGLVYCEVSLKEPGVIVQGTPLARVVFGELDGSESVRSCALVELFRAAGVEATLSQNILGQLWTKFCFICAMSGVTALTRHSLGPVLADSESRILLRSAMAEAFMVGVARGVHFDGDPVEGGMQTAARFNPEAKSSMLRDLERGKRLEIEALNGAAVRLGRAHGIATPVNQAIYAALRLAQPA